MTVDGYDVDGDSIGAARDHAASYGLGDRVRFTQVDAASVPTAGDYDLVAAFECIHDLPDPVGVLRAARRMVRPGGTVLVMDERVPDALHRPRRSGGAADVRHLHAHLPARRALAPALGRHRHRDAARHPAPATRAKRASTTSRSCRSSTRCSASTGSSAEPAAPRTQPLGDHSTSADTSPASREAPSPCRGVVSSPRCVAHLRTALDAHLQGTRRRVGCQEARPRGLS